MIADYFNPLVVEGATDILTEYKKLPADWTLDELIGVYSLVSRILSENENRIEDDWSITFGEACRIVLQERSQAEFEQSWIQWQKNKAAATTG